MCSKVELTPTLKLITRIKTKVHYNYYIIIIYVYILHSHAVHLLIKYINN